MSELVLGIDLGTTNSEVAAMVDGRVKVLGPNGGMLPSCVGLTKEGELLVGEAAKNQQLLYPERTVRSIKRLMGSTEKVKLGKKSYSPPEISALVLRELAEWSARELGAAVKKAVITVPAYFSDAQRTATREAGEIAELEVVRILNEPTAASLAYGFKDGQRHTALVYDLGGGTFDVSIVSIEGDVTEVLASHGNNRLGGDDFDSLLLERLEKEFEEEHGIDLRKGHAAAHARLRWAAEEAKKKLSSEPHARIREEALATVRGKPLHLDREISRDEYEDLIYPLASRTLESVSKALSDAGRLASELDAIVLVGGSTRTPLITRLLVEKSGIEPRQEVHPDLCVALGAGVLASRIGGNEVERVLVDVSPFSFGPSYLGERLGVPYRHCYRPLIRRNTPLPVTRTERYFTAAPLQTAVQVEIYQGEDEDALKNILVGDFLIDGLTPTEDLNEVLCRMQLDVDGILHVTAIEKATGLSKHITITNALKAKSEREIAAARDRIRQLYTARAETDDDYEEIEETGGDELKVTEVEATESTGHGANGKIIVMRPAHDEAKKILERSEGLLEELHPDDLEETIALREKINAALESDDSATLEEAVSELKELLFFVEGK